MRELFRQFLHVLFVFIIILIALATSHALFVAIVGVLLMIAVIAHSLKARWFFWFIERAERSDTPIKAIGLYTLLAGAIVTSLLFPQHLIAGLLVLGVCDGLSTLIGTHVHSPRWLNRATIAGSGAFLFSAWFVLYFFAAHPFIYALILTLAEAIDSRVFFLLDDNFVLPVLTGLLLAL